MRAAKIAGLLAGAALAVSAFCLAASADTVTLTPEQTYALYMRDFTVTYHDTSSNIDYPLQMELYGTSAEVAPPDNLYVSGNIIDNTSTTLVPLWKQHNYIIVRFSWPSGSTFVSPYDVTDYITIVNNLNIAGLNYYSGRILVTVGNAYRPSTNTAWGSVQRTEYRLDTSNGVITHQNAISGAGRPSRILTGLSQTAGAIPADERLYLTGDSAASWFDSANTYSISSLTTVWKSPVQWGYSDTAGHTTINHLHSYFCYIECPTLSSGYIPPATTAATTAATTRREYSVLPPQSTAPAHTVDLSNLESGVAAIVQQEQEINNNLEWIGYNVMGGVNNLAYICNRLDDIYRDMVKSGQIPSNLFPMDGTLLDDIQNGLTSYTTARIPTDAAAGLTFWAWFMGKIMEQAWIAELAALGSCLAVTYFVLFRGRNS